MNFTKEDLLNLIHSRSECITYFKKIKICIHKADLFQFRLAGIPCRNFIYCKNCNTLLKQRSGTTSHLNFHCRGRKHLEKESTQSTNELSSRIYEVPSRPDEDKLDGNWF